MRTELTREMQPRDSRQARFSFGNTSGLIRTVDDSNGGRSRVL